MGILRSQPDDRLINFIVDFFRLFSLAGEKGCRMLFISILLRFCPSGRVTELWKVHFSCENLILEYLPGYNFLLSKNLSRKATEIRAGRDWMLILRFRLKDGNVTCVLRKLSAVRVRIS